MPKAEKIEPGGNSARIISIPSAVAGAPQEMPRQSCRKGVPSNRPSATILAASWTCPVSNTSSSGLTPASRIILAISVSWLGTLTIAQGPKFIVATSRLQMSGLSSTTWATRSAGERKPSNGLLVPGAMRAPGPVVRLIRTSLPASRMRATTSR